MIGDALRISRLALVAAVDRFAIWIVLLALLAIATTLSDAFLRPAYLGNVVRQLAPVGTAAVGATFVMILGGIDLSVGAVISLAVVICAVQMDGQIANIPWALCVTLLTGAGIGLVNGLLAAFSRASPFILTLGTSLAVYGLTQIYSGGTARGIVAPQFREKENSYRNVKLQTYYARKRRAYAEDFPDFFDRDLHRLFAVGPAATPRVPASGSTRIGSASSLLSSRRSIPGGSCS